MGTEKYLIDCDDWNCFVKGNIQKCLDCKIGKVLVICPNCGKEHKIESMIRRIDCECGGGFIPCYQKSKFKRILDSPKA